MYQASRPPIVTATTLTAAPASSVVISDRRPAELSITAR
jgi:hypothetical protein